QRSFPCEVSSEGVAQLTGPALLHRVYPPDFRARYADGTPVSREAKDEEVGLWSLNFEEHTYHFFVGTREAYDHLHAPTLQRRSEDRRGSPGGGDAGQGRHRRRGGGAQNPDPGTGS